MTTAEAAAYARVSVHTITDNAKAGRLSGVKTSSDPRKAKRAHWRFRQADVDAWLEAGRVPVGRPRGSSRRRTA